MKTKFFCSLSSLTLLIGIFLFSGPAGARDLSVSFLDVGQGDSIIMQLPKGSSILIDAGVPDEGPVVLSALRRDHIKSLNLVVATHPHEDHIGGMETVLSAISAKKFLDSGLAQGSRAQIRLLQLIQKKHIPYQKARAGQSFSMDGVKFQVLAPRDPLLLGTESDPNNNSIVLKVTYGKISFLLTGDMEYEERERLYQSHYDLSASVLKLAHHGSVNGTDASFLAKVHPRIAVISVGAGNPYGHPHAKVLSALRKICIYRTDRDGTITISTNGNYLETVTSRHSSAKSGTAIVPAVYTVNRNTASSGKVIGNKKSLKFHRPDCRYLPASANQIIFSNRQKALAAGYSPCKVCNP